MIDFRKLVEALEAHPDIWVARANILPGASEEELAQAEAQLETSLHPEIKAFYAHHNGLAIGWMYKKTDRFAHADQEVDTSELPFWMDLMEEDDHPYDGQIIVAPVGEVFIKSYEDIEEPSDFDPSVAYMEFIEEPQEPSDGKFTFGDREWESEAAFRSQLRFFDHYLRDYGNLMLFEPGKSDPDLLHLEDHWHNFHAERVLPLSRYILHVAHDFGLRWNRARYFHGAEPAPAKFDPADRLAELISETKFPGDLR